MQVHKETATKITHNTPEAIRLHFICKEHFSQKSGVFQLADLLEVLPDYGYKSLKDKSNLNKKKRRIEKLIISSTRLFKYTGNGYYRIVSYRRFKSRSDAYSLPSELLHKKNKKYFTDRLIGIITDSKTIDYKGIAKLTGLSISRIQQACRRNDEAGFIQKTNNFIVINTHKTRASAEKERFDFYKSKFITAIKYRQTERDFALCTFGANSYSSTICINGGTCPLLSRSKVFRQYEQLSKNSFLCEYKEESGFIDHKDRMV